MGDFSRALFNGLTSSYLMYIFVPQKNSSLPLLLPFGALTFAVIRGLGVILDALIDPYIASKSDNCTSKLGRRIPFMRYSAIPMGLFMTLTIFMPLGHQSWVNAIWLLVMLFLYIIASSVFLVPSGALMTELVDDTTERVKFGTINTFWFVVGSAVVYATPVVKNALMARGVSELAAWRSAFIVFGVLGAVTALISSYSVKESDYVTHVNKDQEVPLMASLKATFHYKDFVYLLLAYMLMWIAFTFYNTSLMYYVTMLLGLSDSYSVLIMVVEIGVGIASYPLVNFLAKRVGKKPMLIFANVVYVILYVCIYFSHFFVAHIGGVAFGILIGAFIGFPVSITNIIPTAAFSDLAEYDTIKTGINRSAMFVASRNLLQQLSQAIAMFIVPVVITGSVVNGVANYQGVRNTVIIAAGFIVAGLVFYSLYHDKQITAYIDKHNGKEILEKGRKQ